MNTAFRPPHIAIIGTEGSGKTVLTTMLAKTYSQVSSDGVFLSPLDNTTLKFVERTYHTLASGDWPPSNPAGTLFNLKWQLQIQRNPEANCEMRLVDSAGQDLRKVFGNDQEIASLPTFLQAFAEFCRSADIVICLVNLRDFVGQKDVNRRIDNEAVVKSVLDYLLADTNRSRHLCVAFTQTDLYRSEEEKQGSWPNVAAKYLPYVNQAHLLQGKVTVGAVSAVCDTKNVVIRGTPQKVPAPGFSSVGLDKLMKWIVQKVEIVVAERKADAHKIVLQRQEIERQSVMQMEARQRAQRAEAISQQLVSWLLRIVGIVVLCFLFWWFRTTPPEPRVVVAEILLTLADGDVSIDPANWLNADLHIKNRSSFTFYELIVQFELPQRDGSKKRFEHTFADPIYPRGELVWKRFANTKETNCIVTARGKCSEVGIVLDFGRLSDSIVIVNKSDVTIRDVFVDIQINGGDCGRLFVPEVAAHDRKEWPLSIRIRPKDSVNAKAKFNY